MLTKAEIRAEMLRAREAIAPEDRARLSSRISQRLLASFEISVAQTITLYAAMKSEADPIALESLEPSGRIILYPRVDGNELVFCRATRDTLVPAKFGLSEPPVDARAEPLEVIDLVVVPGLAFSRDGHRIGYGRGFYDRAIASIREKAPDARCIGFCFAAQLHDTLPFAPHDSPLDGVVTEDELLRFTV